MNKLSMKQKATEITREASRQNGLSQTIDILGHLPELIESVEIDSEYLRKRVENELNRKTGNPLNALLGLMGLRIVNTHEAARELCQEEDQSFTIGFHEADNCMDSMLRINPRKLSASSAKIASALSAIESNFRSERQKSKNESIIVFGELDKKTQECAQLNADLQSQRSTIMDHSQYMLSMLGKDSDSPVAEQLEEMLEDLGVYVHWTTDGSAFSDSAMFSELKCDHPENRRMKPCLTSSDAVLMKGIRFVAKNAE